MNVHFVPSDVIRDSVEMQFQEEKQRLAAILPTAIIEHVGGTAVPGLLTKGDLDVCVQVAEEDFAHAAHVLEKHYEINQPHNWTSTYASFKDEARDVGVQLCVCGSEDDYFVRQREHLLEHPELVEDLNELKRTFEGKDMDAYREAKNHFYRTLKL